MSPRLSPAAARSQRLLRRLKSGSPLIAFEPSPGLAAFHADTSRRICLLAANRTGKTRHALAKLARRLLEADRAGTPLRCRVMGPTNSVLVDTHQRYLSELLGAHLAKGSAWRPRLGFPSDKAVTRGGSQVEFCTYKQDPETLESASLHIVLLDEPPPPAHFDACVARVFDTNGDIWVTLTAVNRPVKWLRELVEAGVRDGDWRFYQVPLSKAACPWYTRAQIEGWKRDAMRRPWSYRQRIEAAWEGTSDNRWFSGFSDAQLITARTRAGQGWPLAGQAIKLVLSADHGEGPGHSHWVLFGYQVVSRKRGVQLYVRALGEWTNERRMSVESEALAVKEMVESTGAQLGDVSWCVGDTNVASKSETARTLNERFEQEFARLLGHNRLRVRPAKKGPDSVSGGVATCNQLLMGGELFVSELCVCVVESLRHWAGKDDALKHAADAFRYGVCAIATEEDVEAARLAA